MCWFRIFNISKIKTVLLLIASFCILSSLNKKNNIEYLNSQYYGWIIEIPSINLKEYIEIKDIKEEVYRVTMFSNYGRPYINNTNTVIGAHSGYGEPAIFNNLNQVNIREYIYIYYANNTYIYSVINKYSVIETDLTPLENVTNKTILTLMTCKRDNYKYREILVAELVN